MYSCAKIQYMYICKIVVFLCSYIQYTKGIYCLKNVAMVIKLREKILERVFSKQLKEEETADFMGR